MHARGNADAADAYGQYQGTKKVLQKVNQVPLYKLDELRIGMRSYFGLHRKKTRCRMRSAIDEETGPSLESELVKGDV